MLAAPARPDTVLDVRLDGGFVPREVIFRRTPTLHITGDGRVVITGPETLPYPGNSIPNLRERLLDRTGQARLVDAIRASGLSERPLVFGSPLVTDVPETVVTIRVDGRTTVQRIEAFTTDGAFDRGLPPAALANRARLRALLSRLTNIDRTVGRAHVGPDRPFVADAYALQALRVNRGSGASPRPAVATWAISSVRLGAPAARVCRTVTGPAADALTSFLGGPARAATTRVRSRGLVFAINARPILPGERGCPRGGASAALA
ncbi:MAG: hypothetical protein HYX33_02565 [Actinobacteria bacterium]|nr:hypothetical protein [Actinomycetota bacterium]